MINALVRSAAVSLDGPNSMLGLLLVPGAVLQGGRVRIVRGVVEAHGGVITWFLRQGFPLGVSAAAMTLGHVVWAAISSAWMTPANTNASMCANTNAGDQCLSPRICSALSILKFVDGIRIWTIPLNVKRLK